MQLPDRSPETGIDDISNIDSKIANLAKRYIEPIDKIRSMSRPDVGKTVSKNNNSNVSIIKNDFNNLKVNNSRALESRAHAFYRMLGLPVAVADNSFYNPGFDPTAAQTFTKRQAINDKIDSSLQVLMNLREITPENQRQIFANQNISSSVYALLLRYPLPFKVLADGKQPFDIDAQFFKVDDRSSAANFLALLNPQLSDSISGVSADFTGARHILRPFIVDPKIENTVMPDGNKICVPFLADKKATKLSDNVFLQRPGIELIIRQRLADKITNTVFLNDISKIIKGQNSPSVITSSLDRETLIDTIEALSSHNKINPSATNDFSNFSSTQVTIVSTLIETIKAVIKELGKDMIIIDRAKQLINWFPVPSTDGPGTGPVGASISRAGTSNALSEIDNSIVELRIKKLNAESQLNQQTDLGSFASPFVGSSGADKIKVFGDQLQDQVQKRDRIAEEAFIAMGNIETITGEISGLGLIDILSIYTALWAIDTDTLISFLDDDSFQRMITFNPSFASISAVSARKGGTKTPITTALSKFESKLSNLLSFADKILANQLISPLEVFGGSTV